MIPTFDLRIKNLITVSGVVHEITTVSEKKVQCDGYKGGIKPEDLHPIPLSRELLERAGFQKREKTDLYDKLPIEGFSYHLYAHKIMILHGNENTLCHWLHTRIVFLHQLQNLYYFLTGREIIISVNDVIEITKQQALTAGKTSTI